MAQAMEGMVRGGAEFADLYFEMGSSHSFFFEDGAFEEISSSCTEGVGARVMRNDQVSSSHAPGASVADGLFCLGEAAEAGGMSALRETFPRARVMERHTPPRTPDCSFFSDLDKRLRRSSLWVRQISMHLQTAEKVFMVFNSDGVMARDRRMYTLFGVEVVVEKEGNLQTGYESVAFGLDAEAFFDTISPSAIAQTALDRSLLLLNAPPCPAGVMKVLLAGEAGGTMIHEACGHGLEADIVQKDYSVYRGKIGHAVASPLVTLVDDGTIEGSFGGGQRDDEGTPCGRTVLIERGILKGYMTDVLSARRGGLPLTGNGRRSSYRSIPQVRMTNTYIEPGDSSFEEMMERMGDGLLVKHMGGGEVDPTSGDFVFHVTEGYLVEGGKIRHPVRGATLTGNGPEVLLNIEAVGKDLHFLPGMCGKGGQDVPVTDGQPSLLLGNIVVGGSEA